MAAFWYLYKFNPFHLPTSEQAEKMGNFSEPLSLRLFETLTFILCPGSLLFLFTMDMGDTANFVMWVLVALINGPVYYCIGLMLARLTKLNLRKSN
jgi:hypothetical protein